LLAVQILSRVNAVIEDHVSLNDFFDAVTIAALAAHIDHNDTAADTDSVEVTDELVDSLSDEEVARMLAEKGIELDD
jgi:hypothetical protein